MTLEQRRAQHALEAIQGLRQNNFQGNYRSYIEALPAHIVMSGLGQALATELAAARIGETNRSAKEQAHEQVYKDMQSWLRSASYLHANQDLMQAILGMTQPKYQQAQAELLAYLIWLKKFAQAYLTKGKDND